MKAYRLLWTAMVLVTIECLIITLSFEDGITCTSYHHPVKCKCNSSNLTSLPVSVSSFPLFPTSSLHPNSSAAITGSCEWQSIPIGYCLTFNDSTCTTSSGQCPFVLKLSEHLQYDKFGFLKVLVSNCSAIGDIVCRPLYREGFTV